VSRPPFLLVVLNNLALHWSLVQICLLQLQNFEEAIYLKFNQRIHSLRWEMITQTWSRALKFMLARLSVYLMAPNHFLNLRSNPKHYFSACRAFPRSPVHWIVQWYRNKTETMRRRWICPRRTWRRYNMRKGIEIASERRRQNETPCCIPPASW
jgi:hypothetical protein